MMYLKLAWRNVWRNRKRSIITITSITFAVVLACVMRSMQIGSYERMVDNAAKFYTGYIQIHKMGYWDEKIIDNVFDQDSTLSHSIEQVSGVQLSVPRVESFALASFKTKTKGAMVLGIDPEKEDQLTATRKKLIAGDYLELGDQGILLSEGLATYLGTQVADSLVLLGQGYHGVNAVGIFVIKGIIKFPSPAQNNGTIYMSLKQSQWFYGLDDQLTSLCLVIGQADAVDRIVSDISGIVDSEAYEVMGWRELMPDLVQSIEIDNISGKLMIGLLYIVIGFGMFGTFLMMTAERMYEFGVMMSVGMSRRLMQGIIFLEMLLLSSIGVIVGLFLSIPFLTYYHYHPIYFEGEAAEMIERFGVEAAYFFSLEPFLFYNQAWSIFLLALILGFYPLYVIQRLRPVKAMREAT